MSLNEKEPSSPLENWADSAYFKQLSTHSSNLNKTETSGRELGPGTRWERHRWRWNDTTEGEPRGLCINICRVAAGQQSTALQPFAAADYWDSDDFEPIENAYWQTCWATGALRTPRGTKHPRLFANLNYFVRTSPKRPTGKWDELKEITQAVNQSGEVPERFKDKGSHILRRIDEGDGPLEVTRYLPAVLPTRLFEKSDDVLAVTNGGYFLNFPEEYDDQYSALHHPVGLSQTKSGQFMPPWIRRPCAVQALSLDSYNKVVENSIQLIGPENMEIILWQGENDNISLGLTNDPNAPAELGRVIRRIDPEEKKQALAEGAEVWLQFSGDALSDFGYCSGDPLLMPPHSGAIVLLRGEIAEHLKGYIETHKNSPSPETVNEKFRLYLGANMMSSHPSKNYVPIDWGLAAGPMLVKNGEPILGDEAMFDPATAGEFGLDGAAPTRFPYDADKTCAPRTALGLTPEGDWLLAVVDGRADPTHSIGATLNDMAQIMHVMGCKEAINLDGGGSSIMGLSDATPDDKIRDDLPDKLVSFPSDPGGRPRIVPVVLGVTQRT
jgi:hypothetical protein